MSERGLLPEFSPRALAEASALERAPMASGPGIRDLRERLWVSIDNDSSRDLDQLSVAEALPGGATRVYVAVADVDVLVHRGTALDQHAHANTTSVYTAAGNFPMLPERLSTDLTSLNEDQERLALVIELDVAEDGNVTRSEPYRAAVRNHAKLAYNSVAAWLEGHAPAPERLTSHALAEQLRLQDRAAQRLRRLRREHGSLDLQTPQAEAVFDGSELSDLRPAESNRAKELIEDLMLAANAASSRYLAQRGFPLLRRVLRSPERWDRIVALAAQHGATLPAVPEGPALARFLSERRQADSLHFADLSLSIVKLLGRGEYAFEQPGSKQLGHFGLAVSDYTHSTAPNRRFPDLVIQRLLKAALADQRPPYGAEELAELARHCNEQEQNAAKVERQVNKCAAATLLASRIGERFEAVVTGASPKGTWVRILRPAVEGRVVRGFHGLDVGDRVRVELLETDIERGFIDFARAE
ncbi:MAG TPA: RNB domain-containing ribonuclease, partial [Polyangiales bacterium]|nr:RNB domain-containing ribonuclease [Polyangiales bacterium]